MAVMGINSRSREGTLVVNWGFKILFINSACMGSALLSCFLQSTSPFTSTPIPIQSITNSIHYPICNRMILFDKEDRIACGSYKMNVWQWQEHVVCHDIFFRFFFFSWFLFYFVAAPVYSLYTVRLFFFSF